MTKVKDKAKTKTTGRTLHYYWQEVKKYKWYSLGMIVSTPVVVFIRAILAPLIFADLIEKASMGLPADEMLRVAAVEIIGFFALYVLNKVVLEELRLYWCWKMEVLAMYDLAVNCFTVVMISQCNSTTTGFLVPWYHKQISLSGRLSAWLIRLYGTCGRRWRILGW